jgi:hypothetical protein
VDAKHQPVERAPLPGVEPRLATAVSDVFVYVVVLNLFVEYLPRVLSETFTLSLLTAVLLKVVLEIVVVVKGWVLARFRLASSALGKVAAAMALWLVLAGSKFLVLAAVDLAFGDAVSLGGFVSVTLLIVCLMLARAVVRRISPGLEVPTATSGGRRQE